VGDHAHDSTPAQNRHARDGALRVIAFDIRVNEHRGEKCPGSAESNHNPCPGRQPSPIPRCFVGVRGHEAFTNLLAFSLLSRQRISYPSLPAARNPPRPTPAHTSASGESYGT
jgi:hypothetical protein